MDIKHLQKEIQNFATDREWDQFHNPKNLAMALTVEAAELLEIFQWLDFEASKLNSDPDTLHKATDEVADIAIYLLRIADKLNINLEEAISQKLIKNAEKYPANKVRGSAKKYTTYKE
jgi:dCTP diphosphatase